MAAVPTDSAPDRFQGADRLNAAVMAMFHQLLAITGELLRAEEEAGILGQPARKPWPDGAYN